MNEAIASSIESLEERILEMERSPSPGNIREALDTLGLTNVKLSSAQVIAVLDMLLDGITPVNKDIVTSLLMICEAQKKFLYAMAGMVEDNVAKIRERREAEAAQAQAEAEQAEAAGAEPETDAEPGAETEAAPEAPQDEKPADDKALAAPDKPGKTQAISSIRVDTDRLDSLIELVGKLTVTYAVIAQSGADNWAKVAASLRELDVVINTLQTEVDAIRLVPLKQIFMPMHRLVKSLSQKIGKKIHFEVEGDTLHLDKSIVESLNEPLVHLLRNAVDHGMEEPEERMEAGKDETGRVLLKAYRKGETAYVEVSDDGRGLDPERIRDKAREKGLLGPEEEVSDQEAIQYILKSGFSTAEAVTDVSGRGVGMDAVVNVIRNTLDGDIEIHSTLGKGSTFALAIPLSRSANEGIVEALVCRLGQELFIIPSQDVVEIYVPRLKDVVDLPDGRRTVDVRGEVHSLLSLADFLGVESSVADITRGQTVVVRVGEFKAAILVDEVVRQQQVVITKFTVPVESLFKLPILGYGMMGGSDALVVDTEALLHQVGGQTVEAEA